MKTNNRANNRLSKASKSKLITSYINNKHSRRKQEQNKKPARKKTEAKNIIKQTKNKASKSTITN